MYQSLTLNVNTTSLVVVVDRAGELSFFYSSCGLEGIQQFLAAEKIQIRLPNKCKTSNQNNHVCSHCAFVAVLAPSR